jgi:hypothetical protein
MEMEEDLGWDSSKMKSCRSLLNAKLGETIAK